MKVLLRYYAGEYYAWKEAGYIDREFVVDGNPQEESNIVSVKDDDREEYVKCAFCGTVFKKGSPEIEVHKNRWKNIDTCLSCRSLSTNREENKGVELKPLSNGKYELVKRDIVKLHCRYSSYWNPPVISPNCDRKFCKYKSCEDLGVVDDKDIFGQHPGIFDDIATVDKILDVGYKSSTPSGWYDYSLDYFLKGRNDIRAVVNSIGIIDFFILSYDGLHWRLVYSKKLDKLFDISTGRYLEWNPDLRDSVKEYIKNKISELYH